VGHKERTRVSGATVSWVAASNGGSRCGTGLKDLRTLKSIKPSMKVEQVNSKDFSLTLRAFVLHSSVRHVRSIMEYKTSELRISLVSHSSILKLKAFKKPL